MSLILSIETSTKICSVALHQDQKLLALAEISEGQSHSVLLTTLIQQVLQNTDNQLDNLDAIAIAKGPGSYTGLRIGTATAKGLCYVLNKPLLAVNTLEAMAFRMAKFSMNDYLFCPMIDARRMEVYCGVWGFGLNNILPTQAKIIDNQSFKDLLDENKILFFGDGANKCQTLLQANPNAHFVSNFHPSASSVGELAYEKFSNQIVEDIAYFEPFYLKDFVGKKVEGL
jgi:tRNA threonylcarbamoyladenosine biosynthesis protein TsaB